MNRKKYISVIFLRLLLPLAVMGIYFSLISFSSAKMKLRVMENIHTTFHPEYLKFVRQEHILKNVVMPVCPDRKIYYKDIYLLWQKTNEIPWNSESFLYSENGKSLHMECFQRKPFLRFQNIRGEHLYIDSSGYYFPSTASFACDVPFASGYIFERYPLHKKYSISQIQQYSSLRSVFHTWAIFEIVQELKKDSLLSVLIQNIYIEKNGNVLLIPSVGRCPIYLGKPDRIRQKLKKLSVFYREAYTKLENAGNYILINLQFKNQIVCKLKQHKAL